MPEAWRKAFWPTTALLACTEKPVMSLTKRLVRYSWVVSTPTLIPKKSLRVAKPMITSSMEAFPALSPMPLMQPSTCLAPTWTAARLFATERPRSLWQWTDMTALSMLGTFCRMPTSSRENSSGMV